jgi:hypothetical protein
MKYARLTKEQFDALHVEFSNFLALQSIDYREWNQIKKNKPALAEDELDVFSDMIWDNVLTKAKFLENVSAKHLFLFSCGAHEIRSIVVKTTDQHVDLLTTAGINWLLEHLAADSVSIYTGKKTFTTTRNEALFDLIVKGAHLSDGQLYNRIAAFLDF